VRAVHVTPSGDVMIRCSTLPSSATAQNIPRSGDQHTEFHWTALGAVRAVHVMVGSYAPVTRRESNGTDVMISWEAVPLFATAQNIPSAGDQHTAFHATALGAVRAVHVTPSGDVMIC
jgi:hypothetical protein